jgi:hypothetical protein
MRKGKMKKDKHPEEIYKYKCICGEKFRNKMALRYHKMKCLIEKIDG